MSQVAAPSWMNDPIVSASGWQHDPVVSDAEIQVQRDAASAASQARSDASDRRLMRTVDTGRYDPSIRTAPVYQPQDTSGWQSDPVVGPPAGAGQPGALSVPAPALPSNPVDAAVTARMMAERPAVVPGSMGPPAGMGITPGAGPTGGGVAQVVRGALTGVGGGGPMIAQSQFPEAVEQGLAGATPPGLGGENGTIQRWKERIGQQPQVPGVIGEAGRLAGGLPGMLNPGDPANWVGMIGGGVVGEMARPIVSRVAEVAGPKIAQIVGNMMTGAGGMGSLGATQKASQIAPEQWAADPLGSAWEVAKAAGWQGGLGAFLALAHGAIARDAHPAPEGREGPRAATTAQEPSEPASTEPPAQVPNSAAVEATPGEQAPNETVSTEQTPKESTNAVQEQGAAGIPGSEQPEGGGAVRGGDAEERVREPAAESVRPEEGGAPVRQQGPERVSTPGGEEGVGAPAPVAPRTPHPVTEEAAAKVADELPGPTSARKAMMDDDRAALGLDTLASPERHSWEQAIADAHKQKVPQKAGQIAGAVIAKPRALSDTETAGLVLEATRLKNGHRAVMEEISRATDPAEIAFKHAEAQRIEQDFGTISKALRQSGTEKGRALASQKLTLNKDYDLLTLKTRAKASKGAELTPHETKQFKYLSDQLQQKTTRIAELEKQVSDQSAERSVRRHKVQERRTPPETRHAEFADLLGKVKDLLKAGC